MYGPFGPIVGCLGMGLFIMARPRAAMPLGMLGIPPMPGPIGVLRSPLRALGDGVRVLGVALGADALRPLLAGTGRFAPLLELDPPRGARGGIVTLLC